MPSQYCDRIVYGLIFSSIFSLATIRTATAQTNTLQDFGSHLTPAVTVTIYKAKRVITMDSRGRDTEAVAVVGDRILATGSVEDLVKQLGERAS